MNYDEAIKAFKDLFCDVWKREEETNNKQMIVLRAFDCANKTKKLLELKNREIKLLKARLTYNDNDELYDVMYQENSLALDETRKQITELERELK